MLAVCLSVLDEQSDKDLFLAFFDRYEKKLYHVALSILQDPALAEDAAQEAFLRVARHFKTFKKIFKKSCQEIGPWAVTIVKNVSIDILRKRGREAAFPEEWDPPSPVGVEAETGYDRLVALIRSMPETYRQVLEMKFVLEMKDKEIGKALGLSADAVSQRVRRGRKLLIEKLREEGYEYGSGK